MAMEREKAPCQNPNIATDAIKISCDLFKKDECPVARVFELSKRPEKEILEELCPQSVYYRRTVRSVINRPGRSAKRSLVGKP